LRIAGRETPCLGQAQRDLLGTILDTKGGDARMTASLERQWTHFSGRMLMIGFGCVAQGVLLLLLRHIAMRPGQITVLAPPECDYSVAESCGVRVDKLAVTRSNLSSILPERLEAGDFLLNLSVDVSCVDLMAWCQAHGVLYLDACTEPWTGGYLDASLPPEARTNHALRQAALALRDGKRGSPTAVITHGVNPGLVSHFVKQALVNLGRDLLPGISVPRDQQGWASLAQRLGIRAIHIAERDTQAPSQRKQVGEFVNTWSVEGLHGEACQPAELGWGSHERWLPACARLLDGANGAVWLNRPGGETRVRSWTPLEGSYHGFLITHSESLSIADYLTVRGSEGVSYRPTVLYAYYPCDDTVLSLHEAAGRNWHLQDRRRLLGADEIVSGMDELGVLLLGHARNAYWYGSRLTIEQTRKLCPFNNATSLQTAAGVLSGVVWAIENPNAGIVEPDDLPFRELMAIAGPYLGEMVGAYGDWTPLRDRCALFADDGRDDDPWQFVNMLLD
jgi:homospermidine synthase